MYLSEVIWADIASILDKLRSNLSDKQNRLVKYPSQTAYHKSGLTSQDYMETSEWFEYHNPESDVSGSLYLRFASYRDVEVFTLSNITSDAPGTGFLTEILDTLYSNWSGILIFENVVNIRLRNKLLNFGYLADRNSSRENTQMPTLLLNINI